MLWLKMKIQYIVLYIIRLTVLLGAVLEFDNNHSHDRNEKLLN